MPRHVSRLFETNPSRPPISHIETMLWNLVLLWRQMVMAFLDAHFIGKPTAVYLRRIDLFGFCSLCTATINQLDPSIIECFPNWDSFLGNRMQHFEKEHLECGLGYMTKNWPTDWVIRIRHHSICIVGQELIPAKAKLLVERMRLGTVGFRPRLTKVYKVQADDSAGPDIEGAWVVVT